MKRFQDLVINFRSDSFADVIAKIEQLVPGNWHRDKNAEARVAAMVMSTPRPVCFRQDGSEPYHPAFLWLHSRGEHSCYVSNIVPGGAQSQMSYLEYNSILQDFYKSVISRIESAPNISATLSDENLSLVDYMAPGTAEKLERFSRAANKSTGSAHPNDFERWCDFIVSCHTEESRLDAHILGRWLREGEGWSDEKASELATEFEFAKSLLKFYDKRVSE